MKTLSLKKKRKLILLLVFGLITLKCFEFYEAYDYMVNTILHISFEPYIFFMALMSLMFGKHFR